ncbi:MAG: hypothetical protein WAO76_13210 [Georgfuchsia sp.]
MDQKLVTVAFPDFKFNLSKRHHGNYGWITADDEAFHYIHDMNRFYSALGYTKQHKNAGIMPEDFILDRYNSDFAAFSSHCLQVQICSYLFEHSLAFNEKYGLLFMQLIGKCVSSKINDDDGHCLCCFQHPRFNS